MDRQGDAQSTAQQYSPSLRVDDKPGSLTCQGRVGIKGAGLAEANSDDVADNLLDGVLPLAQADRRADVHVAFIYEVRLVVVVNGVGIRSVLIMGMVAVGDSLGGGRAIWGPGGFPLGPCHGVAVHGGRAAGCGRRAKKRMQRPVRMCTSSLVVYAETLFSRDKMRGGRMKRASGKADGEKIEPDTRAPVVSMSSISRRNRVRSSREEAEARSSGFDDGSDGRREGENDCGWQREPM